MSEASESKKDGEVDAKDEPASAEASDPASTEQPKSPEQLLEEARAEAAKMKEQWVRTAADFDNFRRRARKEVDDARKAGKEDMLKDFLPVFDNLERAMLSAQRATEVKPVTDGLTMILKQFVDTIGRAGITKVPTKGAIFDPTVHEAIQQVESDEAPGTVVAEVQAGYTYGDRLVRAAMVVVAKPKAKEPEAASTESASAGAEEPKGDGEGSS